MPISISMKWAFFTKLALQSKPLMKIKTMYVLPNSSEYFVCHFIEMTEWIAIAITVSISVSIWEILKWPFFHWRTYWIIISKSNKPTLPHKWRIDKVALAWYRIEVFIQGNHWWNNSHLSINLCVSSILRTFFNDLHEKKNRWIYDSLSYNQKLRRCSPI